jgi:hypothetical protein
MRRRLGPDPMSKDHTKTVRIRKVDKVAPDERGRSVWLGKVDAVELELVSTTALEKILKSDGGKTRSEIQKLAAGRRDGILARDAATGVFRIVNEADLENALAAESGAKPGRSAAVTAAPLTDTMRRAADELSLVSTQILRKVMNPEAKGGAAKPKPGKKDKSGGFNPYDNN